tara:strand:- start:379 stop:591 length:213 start_codon:yes stop_codon:yes gene_type:complete
MGKLEKLGEYIQQKRNEREQKKALNKARKKSKIKSGYGKGSSLTERAMARFYGVNKHAIQPQWPGFAESD